MTTKTTRVVSIYRNTIRKARPKTPPPGRPSESRTAMTKNLAGRYHEKLVKFCDAKEAGEFLWKPVQ